jgi:hypothetical protein
LKTKLTPLALLIPAVVLAQPASQAPQPFQATPPVVNQQVNPANTSNSSPGTAAQTLNKQNSGSLPSPANPVAAAAYEKASNSTKSLGYNSRGRCEVWTGTTEDKVCAKYTNT